MKKAPLRFLKFWTLAVLMFLLPLTQASAASEERVQALLEVSGFTAEAREIQSEFNQGLLDGLEGSPETTAEDVETFEKLGEGLFDADRIIQQVSVDLQDILSDSDVDELMTWYQSDIGRAVTQAELDAMGADSQQEMMAAAKSLMQDHPQLMERAHRINELVRGTETILELSEYSSNAMMESMLVLMESDEEKKEFQRMFEQQMQAMAPQMHAQMEQFLLLSFTYTYRDLDLSQVDAYIEFLEKPVTQTYVHGLMNSLTRVMEEGVDRFAERMADSF